MMLSTKSRKTFTIVTTLFILIGLVGTSAVAIFV